MTRHGYLEVICGPMFSGKSTELLRRVRRAAIADKDVLLVKPAVDDRYSDEEVVTHDGNKIKCRVVNDLWELADEIEDRDPDVIAIDEVQFFGDDLDDFPYRMVEEEGRRVIVAGLEVDSDGRCFGQMPYLLAQADSVTKLTAICSQCGEEATRTYRKPGGREGVGGSESYEARCRGCL